MNINKVINEAIANQELSEYIDCLKSLRDEYAPTIEMTKEQEFNLLMMKGNNEHIINIVGDIDYPWLDIKSVFDEFWEPLTEKQLIQAWLNPHTIKVVK